MTTRALWIIAIGYWLLISAFAAQFPGTCPTGKTARFPRSVATPIDALCGLSGTGTAAEGLQDQAKNNFCTGASTAPISLAQIASLQTAVEKITSIPKGSPPASRTALVGLGEGNVVVFEGFVFEARQECKETVNCSAQVPNKNAYHDIHISLIDAPKTSTTNECSGFVAEMIPHFRPPQWTACSVNGVASKGLRVRVTGQQFFDGSHLPCKNGAPVGTEPKRVSLWEIHPIYKFEVCPSGTCSAGGWQPLEVFAKGAPSCPEVACN